MGGYGSGRGIRINAWRSKKLKTTSLPCFHVGELVKLHEKMPGSYFSLQDIKLRINETSMLIECFDSDSLQTKTIKLTAIPCHYGGFRYYCLCPFCKSKVKKLYLCKIFFACRCCFKMAYPSQNQTLFVRLLFKSKMIKDRLNNDEWSKPKWMRWKTFERLRNEYFQLEDMNDLANLLSLRSKKTTQLAMEKYGDATLVPFEVAMTQYGKYWNPR